MRSQADVEDLLRVYREQYARLQADSKLVADEGGSEIAQTYSQLCCLYNDRARLLEWVLGCDVDAPLREGRGAVGG